MNNTDKKPAPTWSSAESVPRYSVGEVSRLFGIHPQTIRYFEKEGLISPMRTPTSGRREYSTYDMYQMALRMQYKNLFYNLEETEQILHDCNAAQFIQKLKEAESRISEKQKEISIKEKGLKRLCSSVEKIPVLLDHFTYEKRPVIYRHLHQINGIYDAGQGSIEARKIFLNTAPLTFFFYELPAEMDDTSYRWDIAAYEEDAFLTGFAGIENVERIESADCIYTIFRIDGDDAVNWSCMKKALAFIESNGWEVNGTVFGSVLAGLTENDHAARYFDAWIPVREKLQQL